MKTPAPRVALGTIASRLRPRSAMEESRRSVEMREQRTRTAVATTVGTASAKTPTLAGRDRRIRRIDRSINQIGHSVSRIDRSIRRRTLNRARCRVAAKLRAERISKARSLARAAMMHGIASRRRATTARVRKRSHAAIQAVRTTIRAMVPGAESPATEILRAVAATETIREGATEITRPVRS